MSRDLSTIAAIEQEVRKQLRDLRLSIANKRYSLDRDENEERGLLDKLNELQKDADAAFARTRAIGADENVESAVPESVAFDADVTAATTVSVSVPAPQDGIFRHWS